MQIVHQTNLPGRKSLGCLTFFFVQDELKLPPGVPEPLRDAMSRAFTLRVFTGKKDQSTVVLPAGGSAERLMLVGLGEGKDLNRELWRRAAGSAGKALASMNIAEAGVWLASPPGGRSKSPQGEDIAEGIMLGSYTFTTYKEKKKGKDKEEERELKRVTLFDPRKITTRDAVAKGVTRGEAVCLARTLGNHPANVMTPTRLAEEARAISKKRGLTCKVMEKKEMEAKGFGMLLGVSRGSRQPPKLITMEYRAAKPKGTLVFVGKGITFDSGGISLKPGQAMDEMKFDMCGAAAVLGAMDAIGTIKPPVNVIGIVPASENLPDGEATKPGDIHKSYSGMHVEILNTDAEGRLVVGDALAYGIERFKPDAVVDLATLTGACVIALGHYATGAITNNEAFQKNVVSAGEQSGDIVWPLPSFSEYEEGLKGKYGDLQNIASRDGGAITGGLFLKNFVGDVPWVHLDIAGTAWGVKRIGYIPNEGATGVGVRLLMDLASSWR
ncbi:MAG: leucyl aminopeptidase [SAR324 cluster bacterium]|nr:leucyl aminopeptidase [SAR324 cluster bacterium]